MSLFWEDKLLLKIRIYLKIIVFCLVYSGQVTFSHSEDDIWKWMPPKEVVADLFVKMKKQKKNYSSYTTEEFISGLEAGNADMQVIAGTILYKPTDHPEYFIASFLMTLRALDDWNRDAMKMIGFYDFIFKRSENIIPILKREIELGNQMAVFILANGLEKETSSYYQKLSLAMYTRAAELGISMAQHNLADRYMKGKLVKQDKQKALDYYRRAANQAAKKSIRSLIDILSQSNLPEELQESYHWCLVWKKFGGPLKFLQEKMSILKSQISEEAIAHIEYELQFFEVIQEWLPRSQR
ncbi:MAG: sel1 repeat family protein [Emcibacter sp.]|nr:sel1 repeat family protein [Emcibacter sp.]